MRALQTEKYGEPIRTHKSGQPKTAIAVRTRGCHDPPTAPPTREGALTGETTEHAGERHTLWEAEEGISSQHTKKAGAPASPTQPLDWEESAMETLDSLPGTMGERELTPMEYPPPQPKRGVPRVVSDIVVREATLPQPVTASMPAPLEYATKGGMEMTWEDSDVKGDKWKLQQQPQEENGSPPP